MKFLLIIMILTSFASSVFAAEINLNYLCDEFTQTPANLSSYSQHFTEDFQKKFSAEKTLSVFSDLSEKIGGCRSFRQKKIQDGKFKVHLFGPKKTQAVLSINLKNELVDGLWITDIGITDEIHSWNDFRQAFKDIDSEGSTSATLLTADGSFKFSYQDEKPLALGSTFKLYILGALSLAIDRGLLHWEDSKVLQETWQSWPGSEESTLYSTAEKMISVSDNPSTDHLLYLLGRENVEAIFPLMGNRSQSLAAPLLSTLEMFKLKWAVSEKDSQEYVLADSSTRRNLLEKLKEVPLSAVGTNGVSITSPRMIDSLEWFGTTSENCDAMFYLAKQKSPEVRKILSKSVLLIDHIGEESSHWSYVGYKGGSEPGVLSMTYLLESKAGNRACLSMTWNNGLSPLKEFMFFDLARKTLKFAETQIP